MDTKNKTVNIFGSKYKIKYLDKVFDEKGNWIFGTTSNGKKEILLSTVLEDGKPIQKEELEITLYHKLIHAILMTGQYMVCNDDEPLVEWLARCLYTLKNQKVL